jgi:peptidoglycan/LPS O-acetylase OafA/YrhL
LKRLFKQSNFTPFICISMVTVPTHAPDSAVTAPPLLRAKMPELDSLRGIAILMVLFFHGFASRYGVEGLRGLPRWLVALTSPGWAGVSLFFALSGFLITGILLDSKAQSNYYQRFYLRRALRILPAYVLLLLLLAAFGRLGLAVSQVSWSFLGLSAVFLANLTPLFGIPMQFGVLWSLAVEEHFYLIWPLLVRHLNRRALGMCAVLTAVLVSTARIIAVWRGYDGLAHYTWLVADGLALGPLLAVILRGPFGTRMGTYLFSAFAFAGTLALLLIDKLFHHPVAGGALHLTGLNLFFTGVVACSLLLGTSSLSFLANRPVLRFFGHISYGLYLLHMLVFNVYDGLQLRFFPDVPSFKGHFSLMLIRFLICSTLAVALATLLRWRFEERFLRLKDRSGLSRKVNWQQRSVEPVAP